MRATDEQNTHAAMLGSAMLEYEKDFRRINAPHSISIETDRGERLYAISLRMQRCLILMALG